MGMKKFSLSGRLYRILAMLIVLGGSGTLVYMTSEDAIHASIAKTTGQLDQYNEGGAGDLRFPIWKETIRIGMEKPWMGWGFGSYKRIFVHKTKLNFRTFFQRNKSFFKIRSFIYSKFISLSFAFLSSCSNVLYLHIK